MQKAIILFDGFCNLCSRSFQFILRRDKKYQFDYIASQSSEGEKIIQKYQLGEFNETTIILIDQEKVYIKSDAVLKLMAKIGRYPFFFRSLLYIPRWLRDFLYDIIARNRYRLFGKRDTCYIPD